MSSAWLHDVQRTITLDSLFPVILALHSLKLQMGFMSTLTFWISGQQMTGLSSVVHISLFEISCSSTGVMVVSGNVLSFFP